MCGSSSSTWGEEGLGPTELPELVRGCKRDSPLAVLPRETSFGGEFPGKWGANRTDMSPQDHQGTHGCPAPHPGTELGSTSSFHVQD